MLSGVKAKSGTSAPATNIRRFFRAKRLRLAAFSVAPARSGCERSLRPCDACFSRRKIPPTFLAAAPAPELIRLFGRRFGLAKGMQEPLESPVRRLAIMGGTFDPIHVGHLVIASEILHALELDQVMFVPAGRPWQKAEYANPEDRFIMTMLAASSHTRFAVSRLELDRPGPTYTVETMQSLRDFYGDETSLYFIAGADAALQLGTWHGLPDLAKLATVIAVARPGYELEGLRAGPDWPELRFVEGPLIEISSTDIRERVRTGAPIDYLVPEPVARYIKDNGLYA